MLPAIRHVAGDTFVFQQDSAPSHRANDTNKLLQQQTLDFIGLVFGQTGPKSSRL